MYWRVYCKVYIKNVFKDKFIYNFLNYWSSKYDLDIFYKINNLMGIIYKFLSKYWNEYVWNFDLMNMFLFGYFRMRLLCDCLLELCNFWDLGNIMINGWKFLMCDGFYI